MTESLDEIYRPTKWEDVIGHTTIVNSLRELIRKKQAHSYLLSGPSGTGKTTLARIAAKELGCDRPAIMEVNGATYTGIDEMREVQNTAQYIPFGRSAVRSVIVDEAHRLSSNAWDSLLKITEEPPKHLYWFFCTTNPSKVPPTIHTRCRHFILKELDQSNLKKLYSKVIKAEQISLHPDVERMIISKANGSARQLLGNIDLCQAAESKQEAASLLKVAEENNATLELCRFLASGRGSWQQAMAILEKLENETAEGIRIAVMHYFAKSLKGAKNDRDARFFLDRIGAFSDSYRTEEGIAPLLLSIGTVVFP